MFKEFKDFTTRPFKQASAIPHKVSNEIRWARQDLQERRAWAEYEKNQELTDA